jgi:small-conductance mechanosensitive channel
MSSLVNYLSGFSLAIAVHLLIIFFVALLLNRFLRLMSNLVVKPAGSSQTRAAQAREQQTRTMAGVLYSAASKIVWFVAILTALDQLGVNPTPALTLAGLASVAIGFGAQNLVRDLITGFYIVL